MERTITGTKEHTTFYSQISEAGKFCLNSFQVYLIILCIDLLYMIDFICINNDNNKTKSDESQNKNCSPHCSKTAL